MALRVLPSLERLIVEYLRGVAEVQALVSQRVSLSLPSSPTYPLVSILLVSGEERVQRHLDAATIQVDVWGGTREQADVLARTVRAALLEMPRAHDTATVTAVLTLVAPRWLPDELAVPPRPRYTADYQIVYHP
jgi:hypothetical protein